MADFWYGLEHGAKRLIFKFTCGTYAYQILYIYVERTARAALLNLVEFSP